MCRCSNGILPGAADNLFRCSRNAMTGMFLGKRSFTRGEIESFPTRPGGWRKAGAMCRMQVDPSTPAFRFAQ